MTCYTNEANSNFKRNNIISNAANAQMKFKPSNVEDSGGSQLDSLFEKALSEIINDREFSQILKDKQINSLMNVEALENSIDILLGCDLDTSKKYQQAEDFIKKYSR